MTAQDNQTKQECPGQLRRLWSEVAPALCTSVAGGVITGVGIGRAAFALAATAAVTIPSIVWGAALIIISIMRARSAFTDVNQLPHP